MAAPLKREVSPAVAVVVIVVLVLIVIGVYWKLSGEGSNISKKPARPFQPPPNVAMPGGAHTTTPPPR
ncbi:MAG: hypothetical protein C4335_08875 [Armatimonadota bacterium]